jgi:hypothetical protein
LDRWLTVANVATMLVLFFALVGAVLVIVSAVSDSVDPALRLTFATYLDKMVWAVGALAIGRGVARAGAGPVVTTRE